MSKRHHLTFIYTNSYDGTTDLIISRLGPDRAFRFNVDMWRDYRIEISPDSFAIESPAGRRITPGEIAKFYWRKPCLTAELFPDQVQAREDAYLEGEIWYALRDLVNRLWIQKKVVLVEPFAEERVGKFVQLDIAAGFFDSPTWRFLSGGKPAECGFDQAVVKSLTLNRVRHQAVLYTSRAQTADLDPAVPWFIQEYVEAPKDVTVVYVAGKLFAFELPRERFLDQTADWRQAMTSPEAWPRHALTPTMARAIRAYMTRLRLHYGRLDFLLTRTGRYLFLEVNPNGEWGWLDSQGKNGVLDRVLAEVSPLTPLRPIPVRRSFVR